jgi:hypothetical protein
VVEVRGKRKCMKLSDTVFFYDLERISEVLISLAWKSDDQISSDIETHTIFSFYLTKFLEYPAELFPIIVTVHRL